MNSKDILDTMKYILKTEPLFDVELSSCCNIKCVFCPRDVIECGKRAGIMDKKTMEKLIAWLPQKGNVMISGLGEPLINPNVYEFVRKVKKKGLGVTIITNGTLLSINNAKLLIEAGIDEIQISFHSIDPGKFSEIELNADFGVVMENIRNLSKLNKEYGYKIHLRLNTIICEENKNQINEFTNLANKYGYTLFIRNLHNRGGHIRTKNKNVTSPIGCGIFSKVTFIKYDGGILPCVNDVASNYELSNIFNLSFEELLSLKEKIINQTQGKLFPMCGVCNDEYRYHISDVKGDI